MEAGERVCEEVVPAGGEGRPGDLLLRSSEQVAIFRTPGESLTLPGRPGATLIDLAPPGGPDLLAEAIPIVGNGQVRPDMVEAATLEEAVLTLAGPLVDPLDPEADAAGEGVVRWRLAPEGGGLDLEGADGAWVVPLPGCERWAQGFQLGFDALGWDGNVTEDAGGAVRVEGLSRLVAGPVESVFAALWPDGVRAEGTCAGEAVEVLAGGSVVGRLPPRFSTPLPPEADGLRCTAAGRLPGEAAAPGEGLELVPGPATGLWVRAAGIEGGPLPVRVEVDGVAMALPPQGGFVPLAAGAHAVRVAHGPLHDAWNGQVEVPVEGATRLEVALRRVVEPGWALVELDREVGPSWGSRSTGEAGLAWAAAEGAALSVLQGVDEVAPPALPGALPLRVRTGSTAASPRGAVRAWPWTPDVRLGGHGAADWAGLAPEDLLALVTGGAHPLRLTVVDTAWVEAAGPPQGWDPRPLAVEVRDPDRDVPIVLDLWSRGVPVGVVGPRTLVPVAEDDPFPAATTLERGIASGASVATSGPLVVVERAPGIAVSGRVRIAVRAQAGPEARVDAVEVWSDAGLQAVLPADRWPDPLADTVLEVAAARFVAAVVVGADWAVSAPLVLE